MNTTSFVGSIEGAVLLPGNSQYESARRVWNAMIDRRPALIVRVASVGDVVRSLKFASENGLLVAVRGGGHNVAGNAVCDGGLVIDLTPMKGVRVDAEEGYAHAGAGLTLGELDRETQTCGLAVPSGLISTTGIAGLTLGGGIGWLSRQYGLTCDNLISADLVMPDGSVVTASSTENTDLFWGLRGGGGNFGIVTSFQYRLHPVRMVVGGPIFHPFDDAARTLGFYRAFAGGLAEACTSVAMLVTAPPAPFLPTAAHGRPISAIMVAHCGAADDAERTIRPLRSHGIAVADLIKPIPYLALQTLNDPMSPPGVRHFWKSEFLTDLSPGAIDALIDGFSVVPSPFSAILIHHLGGAVARVGEDDTAYSRRKKEFLVVIDAAWVDAADDETNIAWARNVWATLRSFSAGGTYVNFLGDEGPDRVRDTYGDTKLARLRMLKAKYDPGNLLRLNQNVLPATS